MNELKDAFYSLKSNKSPEDGDISYNVIKKCFDRLCQPKQYLFEKGVFLSIEKGVFLDNLKMTEVSPLYKGEESNDVSTLECQMSVLLAYLLFKICLY